MDRQRDKKRREKLNESHGYDKTLAQMTEDERNNRIKYKSVDSFEEFAKWYRNNKKIRKC